MIAKVYSCYDTKAQVYHLPFFAMTDGAAIRQFSDWVNDATNPYGKHPADYNLFYIGLFDDGLGMITPSQEGPKVLIGGEQARSNA